MAEYSLRDLLAIQSYSATETSSEGSRNHARKMGRGELQRKIVRTSWPVFPSAGDAKARDALAIRPPNRRAVARRLDSVVSPHRIEPMVGNQFSYQKAIIVVQPTLTECYAQFGIRVRNPRRLWSAVSPTERTVVTLWTDNFDPAMIRYSNFGKRLPEWQHRRENCIRAGQLAAIGVGGTFESIVQTAADPRAHPRRARERRLGATMRLLELDRRTGEFRAEVVPHA
jgi:hypothetical protein